MIGREDVPVLSADQPAIDALAELSTRDVRRGLVIDDGRLAGFLSMMRPWVHGGKDGACR